MITIKNKSTVLALLIKKNFKAKGIKFFTPLNYSQQLGYMNRPKGYVVQAHLHKPVKRQIMNTREVLIVKKGKIRTYFYDNKKKYVCSKIIKTGDILLLVNGGHGFEMLEKSEVFEVKQGPYKKNKDKILF
jgi:hypothetical protein